MEHEMREYLNLLRLPSLISSMIVRIWSKVCQEKNQNFFTIIFKKSSKEFFQKKLFKYNYFFFEISNFVRYVFFIWTLWVMKETWLLSFGGLILKEIFSKNFCKKTLSMGTIPKSNDFVNLIKALSISESKRPSKCIAPTWVYWRVDRDWRRDARRQKVLRWEAQFLFGI